MCFKESSLLHAIQKGGSSPFNKKMNYLLMASLMIVGIEQSLFSSVGIRGVKEFVWLWIDVRQPLKPSARGNFSASPTCTTTPRTRCGARSTSSWVHRNHPSGHLGGWATLWSAEEKLEGQHQIVYISTHTRSSHKGLLQKRLEEDLG